MSSKNKHLGGKFDGFLEEEGLLEEAEAAAVKRVVAFQFQKAMKRLHWTKSGMAKKMHTSRSAVDRLFDPQNESVTLLTLHKAAHVLGKRLKVELA